MPRLPYVDPNATSEPVREALAQLPVSLNIFRMMAHAESCFRPLLRLGMAILGSQQLDAKLRELAILHAVRLCSGEYEWVQHVPIARAMGATPAQVEALARGGTHESCFDAAEQAVLRFTQEVVTQVKASDGVFSNLRAHLPAREIVELILAIGYYTTLARLTENTETELDEPAGTRVLDAARS